MNRVHVSLIVLPMVVVTVVALCWLAASAGGQEAAAGPTPAGPADPQGMAQVNKLMADFDQVRALHTRSLIRAQELKTAYLYGRGWGLDLPESHAEDLLIEGLWIFDYLDSLDLSGSALISYGIANNHPNLAEEMRIFQTYMGRASAMTVAYHDRVTKLLADTVAKINAAAKERSPFELQTMPGQPKSALPAQKFAGDGFNLGFSVILLPKDHYKNYLDRHSYSPQRVLEMSAEAGVSIIHPMDHNVFDWADVEKEAGKFDWSNVDKALAMLKQANMAIHLEFVAPTIMPPDWVTAKFGDRALLTGPDGKPVVNQLYNRSYLLGVVDRRKEQTFVNLFDPEIAALHAGYIKALIERVGQQGVRISTVQVGGSQGHPGETLPVQGGPAAEARFRAWLTAQKIDPRKDWGVDAAVADVSLSTEWQTQAKETASPDTPGGKRMANDILRWREDEQFRYIKTRVEAVRAVAPDMPICTSIVHPFEFNDSINGRPVDRIVSELGVIPWEFSGRNHLDDARRSLSPVGATMASCSTGCGIAYTQYQGSAFAHDALMVMTHPWPMIRAFYHGEVLIYPDMRWEWSSYYTHRRFRERAQGMGPEMLYTSPQPQVAVLQSDTSGKYQGTFKDYLVWTYGPGIHPANYNHIEAIGWGHLLDCLHLSHDVVTEEMVRKGGLARFQVLVAPAAQALPEDVAAAIRKFVEDGGTLISTSALGLFGPDMAPRGGGQLADVLGADVAAFRGHSTVAESPMNWPICDSGLYNNVAWRPNDAKARIDSDSLRTLFCHFKPRDGAAVLEKFTDGEPAVVMNAFGKGKSVAIGYPMGRECFLSDVYHMHYGNNWMDCPESSRFTQGLVNWLVLLLDKKLEFKWQARVLEETAPRSTSMDASWPTGFMPRATQEYRDYVWQTGPGRSVEIIVRGREGNPQRYVELYNRESSYGQQPGVVQFEASSKNVTFDLRHDPEKKVKHAYDINLGCPVPLQIDDNRIVVRTMIEPAMMRMFAVSYDDTVRLYEGNRSEGGPTDAELYKAVATRPAPAIALLPVVTIGAKDIAAFFAERGPKGVVISCEDSQLMPSAKALAAAIEPVSGTPVRITRNAPRIKANWPLFGLGGAGQNHDLLEEPDIILGGRHNSHYIARYGVTMTYNTTMQLPFMPGREFPGEGNAIVMLTRPYQRLWGPGRPEVGEKDLFKEQPVKTVLVIGASDTAGAKAGVESVVKSLGK